MRAALLALLLTGCDDTLFGEDGTGKGADTGPLPTGHAGVVAIFEADCVSCHPAGGTGSGPGLDLEGDLCTTIVGAPSQAYTDATLVVAGDSAGSVVWNKMANTGEYGGVMPLGGELSQEEIDIVAGWIDDGATCD